MLRAENLRPARFVDAPSLWIPRTSPGPCRVLKEVHMTITDPTAWPMPTSLPKELGKAAAVYAC